MVAGLQLQHFRSYSDASFEFNPGVNIIVGPNASGKTNLLEAVMVLARGSSYRASDGELIKIGEDWARLDGRTENDSKRIVKFQCRPSGSTQKMFEIDEKPLARLLDKRQLPIVLFEPEHLLLLSGQPELRRNYLDDLIEQVYSGYSTTRKLYRRVISQRNSLLKSRPNNLSDQLFVWNIRASELGGQIASRRQEIIDKCNAQLSEIYSAIATKKTKVDLKYNSKFSLDSYESSLLSKLESNTDLELARGYTLYGPHRDDLKILIGGQPAEETASRGEVRTLVLALKIMELQIIGEARGQKPILLLDDVFSELDGRRRQALTGFVQKYQTFITTTDADLVVRNFINQSDINVIPLN
ncbi:MAG: DNA replication/repair protein RecF [Candidatus Saccharimonadales bacterium]